MSLTNEEHSCIEVTPDFTVQRRMETRHVVFLDVDIDDQRAAYKLAEVRDADHAPMLLLVNLLYVQEFVDKCSIKYGLSSNKLDELGGGERKSLPSTFDSDYEVRP